jgi:RNA polymerase-associated protein LEO1
MSEEQDIDELFGDDEVQDDAQQQQAGDDEDLFGDNEAEAEEQQEDERQAQRDDGATGQPIHIEAPLTNLPAADKLHLLNLKNNLIGLQPKPFDPDTYERETGYITDAQTGEKKPLLVHDNTIRWRWQQKAHGQLEMVSNARMVQWDDGSQQLMIGDEAFDVVNQDISQNGMYLYTVGGIIQASSRPSSWSLN